jgi:undecaprenyl-diphosphatase
MAADRVPGSALKSAASPAGHAVEVAPVWLAFAIPTLLLGFGLIIALVVSGDTSSFDRYVLLLFRRPDDVAVLLGPPWLQEAARDVTSLGSESVLGLISLLTLGYVCLSRRLETAIFFCISVLGGQALSFGLKLLFQRPRPELVPHAARVFTASFPSSHAMLSAVTYLTLGCVLARFVPLTSQRLYVSCVAVFLTCLIGVSRLYLGVHWPTDVLAGWVVGSAWALICWAIALKLQRRGQLEAASTTVANTGS